ncbi:MAG TPA: transcriptional repressor [Dehalococcoidia bacterium]|nr:transcriptional repressor [Dehalococcoidia bacterium]
MSCEAATVSLMRQAGHKMTPQRMMILSSLRHSPRHQSAVEIFEQAKASYPYMDISTVYRTLDVLKDLRLVSETHMGGAEATFEWVAPERHHHLICRDCGGVTEIDDVYLRQLGEQVERSEGFRADIDHFAIFGLCKRCLSKLDQA